MTDCGRARVCTAAAPLQVDKWWREVTAGCMVSAWAHPCCLPLRAGFALVPCCPASRLCAGGCPPERPVEVQSEPCLNLHLDECRTGVCMRETCCRQHAINRCCRELPCIQQFKSQAQTQGHRNAGEGGRGHG